MKVSHFVTNCHFNKSTCKINQYWLKPVSLDETWKRDICGLLSFGFFWTHSSHKWKHFAIAFSNSSKSKTLKICKKKIIIEEKKIRAVEILVPELLLRQVVLNLNISVISSSRFFFLVAIRINSYFYLIITAICQSEHCRFHWQLTTVWKHREGRGGYKSGNCHAV